MGLTLHSNKKEIKTLTLNYDTWLWEKELNEKRILKYYREGKGKLEYEFCYRNNLNSMFYARARLNALGLEEARGRGKAYYNRICKLCGQEEEDLIHFMLKCPFLEKRRDCSVCPRRVIPPCQIICPLLNITSIFLRKRMMDQW